MAFSINTNTSSLQANLYSNLAEKNLQRSLAALSSGIALANAATDASGLAIADGMSAQVSGLGQAMMNINDGIGLVQTADGALSGVNDNLSRIRELTLQASNGIMNDSNKAAIQKEIDQLVQANDAIVNDTKFNDKTLLDGTASFTFQTGSDSSQTQTLTVGDMSSSNILGSGVDVTTAAGLSSALDNIDNAMAQVGDTRSTLGATQNALASSFRNVSSSQINIASAQSQIMDIDFAAESARFSQQNLLTQTGLFGQSQANIQMSQVLNLLR